MATKKPSSSHLQFHWQSALQREEKEEYLLCLAYQWVFALHSADKRPLPFYADPQLISNNSNLISYLSGLRTDGWPNPNPSNQQLWTALATFMKFKELRARNVVLGYMLSDEMALPSLHSRRTGSSQTVSLPVPLHYHLCMDNTRIYHLYKNIFERVSKCVTKVPPTVTQCLGLIRMGWGWSQNIIS